MRNLALFALLGVASAGHVSMPFSRLRLNQAVRIGKRDTIDLEVLNNMTGAGYYAELEIGTPGQKLSFLIDTGSSDTWVNEVNTDLCTSSFDQSQYGYCTKQFDSEKSKTFRVIDEDGFDINYLDGRGVSGDYFRDTVTVEGNTIGSQQLGLAKTSTNPTGIMGLGFSANVAAYREYPTIVDNMVKQGIIDRAAFSLYLDDVDSESGQILFGGIDTEKYVGKLATLPLIADALSGSDNITSFNVKFDGFKVDHPNGKDDIASLSGGGAEAILDSGSTICLLPDSVVEPIYDHFEVKYIREINTPFIDCAWGGSKGNGYDFNFSFKGKDIKVPMSQMVVNSYAEIQDDIQNDPQLREIFEDFDEGVCLFGIGATSGFGVDSTDFILLGDTFLRSAYVVYDLTNQQVSLAQANLNSTDSNIIELDKGRGGIANATGVPENKANTGLDGVDDSEEDAAGLLSNPFKVGALGIPAVATVVVILGAVMGL